MRISDWSSDVCSSDLRLPVDRLHRLEDAVAHGQAVVEDGDTGGLDVLQPAVEPDLHLKVPSLAYAPDAPARSRDRSEERRVGKEGVSTCRSRWSRYH